ncbi:MAG: GAF domain-containing protein [Ignavibacteriae bacterium]|nr:MAG: GAF domain-containing protein [Ignavibacteriota bacterium]
MADSIVINSNHSTEEKYRLLIKQLKNLLNKKDNFLSNLSNLAAALNQSFDKISWIGFYLFDGEKLYLGPFQGNVACTEIELGKGVCGTSAEKKKSIIVPDVDKFPGHIVCVTGSRSEIVIPVIKNDELFGVLDIDSYEYNSFNDTDKKYLEEICTFLSKEILN